MKIKLKVKDRSDEEEQAQRVATKGKRSRQIAESADSDSDNAPPLKRRTSSASQRTHKPNTKKSSIDFTESESDGGPDQDVDVEGTDSESRTKARQRDEDDDVVDTESSRSASPPPKRQHSQRVERTKSKPNRIQSDEEGEEYEGQQSDHEPEPAARRPPVPRQPTRQPTASSSSSTPTTAKPLRKPVTSKPKDKDEKSTGSSLSNIPAIPRRPKDASTVVKDTQDMDLMNKDVYDQLFNPSTLKPVAKTQNDSKQKETNAKRAAAKAALVEARTSSFDLQLPTDKVLAFENRLRKLHRWYAPSALGFTYHEELRLQRQRHKDNPNQATK